MTGQEFVTNLSEFVAGKDDWNDRDYVFRINCVRIKIMGLLELVEQNIIDKNVIGRPVIDLIVKFAERAKKTDFDLPDHYLKIVYELK